MSRINSQTKSAQLVSTKVAAERLDVSDQAIRCLIRDGKLKGCRVGRLVKVDAQSVEDFISKNALGA